MRNAKAFHIWDIGTAAVSIQKVILMCNVKLSVVCLSINSLFDISMFPYYMVFYGIYVGV